MGKFFHAVLFSHGFLLTCHWHLLLLSLLLVAQVQKPAPEFTLPAVVDGEFKDISLSDYKGKYVVLFWYPMDFTFVCPTEILAFSDRVKEFEALNTAVLAASCDSGMLAW